MQPALQLYTLRNVEQPLPALLDAVGETAFEGVEFAGLGDADPARLAETLAATDLAAVGAHVGIESFEDDPDGTLETYEAVGCDRLVIPWLPPDTFATAESTDAAIERLTRVAERVHERGIPLDYHNHAHEFARLDGEYVIDRLLERTPEHLGFQLDVGTATLGGADPLSVMDRYADRITTVHLKDVDREAGDDCRLGEGDLDLEAIVAAAREADVEWLIYEYERASDPFDAIAQGSDRLASLL